MLKFLSAYLWSVWLGLLWIVVGLIYLVPGGAQLVGRAARRMNPAGYAATTEVVRKHYS